jgi:Uma2 family endonuclease
MAHAVETTRKGAPAPARAAIEARYRAMLILDPALIEELKAKRWETGAARFDEAWDGIYVMSPNPDNEHLDIEGELSFVFKTILDHLSLGRTQSEPNVSDRDEDWTRNYRNPDLAVFLPGGRARDCGTHWVGGPDFAVEILSPDDRAREKIPFYSKVGVRELLCIDRTPWALELYRLRRGRLVSVGVARPGAKDPLRSQVLPLEFRLAAGDPRPRIEVVHRDGVQRWSI